MNTWSIQLTTDERSSLEKLIHSGSGLARTINRAHILLLADHSQNAWYSDETIARMLNISVGTAYNTRKRFVEHGLDGALYDKPRPGAQRKIDGEAEAKLSMIACSPAPEGYNRWTVRMLADKMVELGYVDSVSHNCIAETLKKTRLNRGASRVGASPNHPLASSPKWKT